jgi:hypothetical protein
MPFPYIFTFYSYKGGVGRSMALMNVAYTLAGWGRHVLMVDMDLEAPGISGFLSRSEELAAPEGAHPKDILTLLSEAIGGGRPEDMPPVSNYVRTVAESKLEKLKPRLGRLGRLDVLGTDLERDYMGRLSQLGLQHLTQDELIALSRTLHFYFKAQRFPFRPLGVEDFEPPIDTPYDYVLVDSRTGITEIGGLCVGPLADRLVVVTGLNDQNISGTLAFLKEAGIEPKPRSKDEAPWDDADRVENPSLGPKPTILVASPVPAGEIERRDERLNELENLFGIRPIPLPYHPRMALIESVFVRDYPQEYLGDAYRRLTVSVMEQVGDDAVALAAKVWPLPTVRDSVATIVRAASQVPDAGVQLLEKAVLNVATGDPLARRQAIALLIQSEVTSSRGTVDWGITIMARAMIATQKRALEEPSVKLLNLEKTRPGAGRYNLSCLAAWEGNADDALHWLRAAASAGQKLSRAQIAAEEDFDRIRDDPDFASYVQSLPEN